MFRRLSVWQKIQYAYHFYRFRMVYKKDRASIEHWQETRLRNLIPALERNIPLYRELLRSAGVTVRDIRTLSDLSKLPVTSKHTFAKHSVAEYAVSHPTGTWVTTSGTSGMPFTALRRAIAHYVGYQDFMQYRFLMEERPWRFDVSWARSVFLRVLPIGREHMVFVSAERLFSAPEVVITDITAFDPYIIEGHASFLEFLADAVKRPGVGPRPRYALSLSERLSPASRAHLETQLRCTVFDRYGLEEFGAIGIDCKAHDGFHVHVESCIVEIVDADGHPVPEGQSGKVLITDLYNHEMPFVRYDTGDRGHTSWQRCACGLRSQRVWITGRYSATLTFPSRIFHQFEFSEMMQLFTPFIFRYLIVKRSDTELEVRLIPTAQYGDETAHQIKKAMAGLLGPDIRITVTTVESIPRLPRGKSKIVLDESPQREPAAQG